MIKQLVEKREVEFNNGCISGLLNFSVPGEGKIVLIVDNRITLRTISKKNEPSIILSLVGKDENKELNQKPTKLIASFYKNSISDENRYQIEIVLKSTQELTVYLDLYYSEEIGSLDVIKRNPAEIIVAGNI